MMDQSVVAAVAPLMMEPVIFDMDKLSYEIFNILESKFLFGQLDNNNDSNNIDLSMPATPVKANTNNSSGKVRILSIDSGDALLAAAALSSVEAYLRRITGDSTTIIADFFDLAAGSGAGGVLAAMLFTRGSNGNPLFSAEQALRFFLDNENQKMMFSSNSNSKKKGIIFRRKEGIFRRVFGSGTLRDTVCPLLVPCYDLATGAPFVFSRADAVEIDAFDFSIADICAATCSRSSSLPVELSSIDGRTNIRALGGAVAMANPTATAITHVLNNKQEFPLANSTGDLIVLSLGGGHATAPPMASASTAVLLKIAGEGAIDMVDQAVAMAFGHNNGSNYIRIQGQEFNPLRTPSRSKDNNKRTLATVDQILAQRNVESILFRGKKMVDKTNAEKLEILSMELIKEHQRRQRSPIQTVALKHALTPRTSSATTSTTLTLSSTTTSASTSP